MALSITILQPASLTATVDGASILAAVVGASATLNVDVGVPGPAATVQVGTTTTGDAGTDAEVVNVGTLSAAILDFTIPRGDQGVPGEPGVGVPTGGSAGQVLAKIDGTNYNTEWIDGGSGGDYLPLTGGTLTGTTTVENADFNITNGNFNLTTAAAPDWVFYLGDGGQYFDANTKDEFLFGPSEIKVRNQETGLSTKLNLTGITFPDETTQTTAADVFLDQNYGGLNLDVTGKPTYAGYRVLETRNDGEGDYLAIGQMNTYGFNFVSEGNPNGDWRYAFDDGTLIFKDETEQTTAYNPAVLNNYLPITSQDYRPIYREVVAEEGGTMGDFRIRSFSTNTEDGFCLSLGNGGGDSTEYIQLVAKYHDAYIQFKDDTIQRTAGLPLTGGIVTNAGYTYELLDEGFVVTQGTTIVNVGNAGININGAGTGIQFPDSTIQNTAGLPLTGGTISGGLTISTGGIIIEEPNANGNSIDIYSGGAIRFGADDSYQTTAYDPAVLSNYLPLTGGTLEGNLDVNKASEQNLLRVYDNIDNRLTQIYGGSVSLSGDGDTMSVTASAITFPDNSQQLTAFPPASGTISQYIDGTGGLVEFPEVGDRYLTSSNNPLTIDNGNGKTLTVGTGLAYSPQQNITVYHNAGNFMSGTVVSYNSATGDLVFDSDHHTGSGTFSSWTVNVGGAGGVLTFATSTEARAGTSTTTVISPATLLDAKFFQGGVTMNTILWSTATSGAGASAFQQNGNGRFTGAPTTAIGYSAQSAPIVNCSRGGAYSDGFDFSKRVMFGARIARNVVSPDVNSVWRFSIGKFITTTNVGDLTTRGLMIKVAGSGALQLLVHNGTTLTTTTSSYTPTNAVSYDFVVVSDGAGNVTLFVNGLSVATSTGGPTSTSGASCYGFLFECQNIAVITGSPQFILFSNPFAQVNV